MSEPTTFSCPRCRETYNAAALDEDRDKSLVESFICQRCVAPELEEYHRAGEGPVAGVLILGAAAVAGLVVVGWVLVEAVLALWGWVS